MRCKSGFCGGEVDYDLDKLGELCTECYLAFKESFQELKEDYEVKKQQQDKR
jgi:hypothetical protein